MLDVAYAGFKQAFFLHDLLASGVSTGEIAHADATAFVEALERRERSGSFLANAMDTRSPAPACSSAQYIDFPCRLPYSGASPDAALRPAGVDERARGKEMMWT